LGFGIEVLRDWEFRNLGIEGLRAESGRDLGFGESENLKGIY
jgi:hypothetical protein